MIMFQPRVLCKNAVKIVLQQTLGKGLNEKYTLQTKQTAESIKWYHGQWYHGHTRFTFK